MATAPKFRIDVAIHDLLMNGGPQAPRTLQARGLTLPEPVFPQHPELLHQDGPQRPPEKREWSREHDQPVSFATQLLDTLFQVTL